MTADHDAATAIEAVVRDSYDRLVAYLARASRDIAGAEDALGDAIASALESWSRSGVPDRPESWLLTVAKNNLIGSHRRRQTAQRALPTMAILDEGRSQRRSEMAGPVPDDRLQLLYVCAHPAIDTMGQRLSRAKAKIRDAGIPFEIPDLDQLPSRTRSVLDAIYAAYGTGWDDPEGTDPKRRGLTDEAMRLGRLMVVLQPEDPEAHGLLSLMLHTEARRDARRDATGRFVPLESQLVGSWSQPMMAEAEEHLGAAAALHRLGPYQLHAAIQSVHNRRALSGMTDWAAIAFLYDGLVELAPSVGALVARAAAHANAGAVPTGLRLLDELDADLVADYQPYFATQAHMLELAGRRDDAVAAATRAIGLTTDPAVRHHLIETYG